MVLPNDLPPMMVEEMKTIIENEDTFLLHGYSGCSRIAMGFS